MSYAKEDVKDLIELEDICIFLEYFDAEPQIMGDYIVAKTICHGGHNHKLYYYSNSQLFQCYTECQDSFDIFELIQKVTDVDSLNQAIFWAVNFFNLTHKVNEAEEDYSSEDWKILNRYEKINSLELPENKKLEFQIYSPAILEFYPQPEILSWTKEGISKEVCDYMGIHYDPVKGSILIPHTNENGDIVGIRQRTLVQEDEVYGKYRPWKLGEQMYNHALAFNLYSSPDFWKNIEKARMAVVFEGEKSVLKYMSYFGLKNDISCAVCGNSLSKYQFQLLKDHKVDEIVIAFDRDFEDEDLVAQEKVEEKLQKVYDKYNSLANISFLYDAQRNTLGYKNSPVDDGPEAFMYLFRNRVIL